MAAMSEKFKALGSQVYVELDEVAADGKIP